MMGWRYLSSSDERLVLWRNTIQLFYQSKKPHFVGPFKAAGFNYEVERPFLTVQGEERRVDLVASGETGWLVLELSINQKSKEPKLDNYQMLEPRYLGQYGLPIHDKKPDVVTSRLSAIDDGPYCQIVVKDYFDIKNIDNIENQHLKIELNKAKGMDLRNLPEIPITLVPEMKKQEIRRGLIGIVLQLFAPNSKGKTPLQFVDEGLERISEKIGVSEKRGLMNKVKDEMNYLVQNQLSGYIEFKDGTYMATEKFKPHHRSMEHVTSKLKEWAGPTPQTTLLDGFPYRENK